MTDRAGSAAGERSAGCAAGPRDVASNGERPHEPRPVRRPRHRPEPPSRPARHRRALRAAGHGYRTVKEEIRENLLAALSAGTDPFPGIVGFDDTVLPELERALLAGHDLVLLGERGQGKTRLIRTLVGAARRVDAR